MELRSGPAQRSAGNTQVKDLVKQARTAAEPLQGQVLNRTNGKATDTKKTKAA